jgi:hypothetical protein
MARQTSIWSPTGGLYALAFAVLVVGGVSLSGVVAPARYQFIQSDLGYTSGIAASGKLTDQFKKC